MSCLQTKEKLHEYMDGELSLQERHSVTEHLEHCQECRHRIQEFQFIQGALGRPVSLPAASQRQILRRIEVRNRRGWIAPVVEWVDYVYTYWRDLDKNVVRAKLVAVPLSLMFFVMIAGQFPVRGMQEWTYSVFYAVKRDSASRQPVMVQVMQPNREINDLVDTAWRIPYEDSLSVVASIDAFGGASIGDVLEYPKNSELLEKVGRTLQQARFESGQPNTESFIIYSFQKIDVYEGQGRGL